MASSVDNTQCVRALLARGADVDARDSDRFTPLHHSVFSGAHEALEVLLDRKADVNARGTARDRRPRPLTPSRARASPCPSLIGCDAAFTPPPPAGRVGHVRVGARVGYRALQGRRNPPRVRCASWALAAFIFGACLTPAGSTRGARLARSQPPRGPRACRFQPQARRCCRTSRPRGRRWWRTR